MLVRQRLGTKALTVSHDISCDNDCKQNKMAIGLLRILICLQIAVCFGIDTAYVSKNDRGEFKISTGVEPANWVALAEYDNKVNATG